MKRKSAVTGYESYSAVTTHNDNTC